MSIPASTIPWEGPHWREEADAWIAARMAEHGLAPIGEVTQPHIRPWSTVLMIPTDSGTIYFKATSPAFRHEAVVTQALAQWAPEQIVPVLAIDPQQGWLLLEDAGTLVRQVLTQEQTIDRLLTMLPQYAHLQQQMAEHAQQLLTLKILDRRLSSLPRLYDALLADRDALYIDVDDEEIDEEDSLSTQDYERLLALSDDVLARCEALSAMPIPQTLHHDDFHDGNIFIREGRFIFMDWAESAVAHPFFSMQVFLRGIGYRLNLPDDAPELTQLRDVYLHAWRDYDTEANLLHAYELAQPLAMISRALTWYAATKDLPPAIKTEHALSVPGWLGEYLAHAGA